MTRRQIRIVGISALIFLSIGALSIGKIIADKAYFNGYDASAPLAAEVTEVQEKEHFSRHTVAFRGWHDEQVPALLLLPKNAGEQPAPCVIFLHALRQDKSFVEERLGAGVVAEPFLRAGFALASFDQYFARRTAVPKSIAVA